MQVKIRRLRRWHRHLEQRPKGAKPTTYPEHASQERGIPLPTNRKTHFIVFVICLQLLESGILFYREVFLRGQQCFMILVYRAALTCAVLVFFTLESLPVCDELVTGYTHRMKRIQHSPSGRQLQFAGSGITPSIGPLLRYILRCA